MAFLDNSGDIILDAVLTDTGRFRLAKGDGSFKIVKFALGDDEINYGSYNKSHASGSAYYDLEILQTPVLEAFTNNTSTMKSKLISIPRTNLLYLPVMKLSGPADSQTSGSGEFDGSFTVLTNLATAGDRNNNGILDSKDGWVGTGSPAIKGVMNGYEPFTGLGSYIRIDQGLDTGEIGNTYTIDADLNETQYIIEMDNRFGSIVSIGQSVTPKSANVSYIDDDNIASYYLSKNTDPEFIEEVTDASTIAGPRGTSLRFKIQASTDLATSTYLFEQLGTTGYTLKGNATTAFPLRYIDSIIKVTGATTGYSISIPVRFARKVT